MVGRLVVGLLRWSGWRDLLARLPLPMLALAAAYGVYGFSLRFVPEWVAIVQACAFELVYIGLAVVRLDESQQRRARSISLGAVVVSIAYNSLDGLWHRRPDLLVGSPLWADVLLAILHGAPLAVLAYLVADLLLHAPQRVGKSFGASPAKGGRPLQFTPADLLAVVPADSAWSRDLAAEALGCSATTADRLLDQLVSSGQVRRLAKGRYRLGGQAAAPAAAGAAPAAAAR